MIRNPRSIVWLLSASLFLALSAGLRAQEQKPEAAQRGETKKQGTGVAPPGVRLVEQMPSGASAKPFRFPQAATKTLANGLQVFVITDHREPAVAARLLLTSAGTIHDPAGLPGVASMTAQMVTQGTEKRTAQQIAEAIDFVGGRLTANAGDDSTVITVAVVNKDLELGMDLLSDVTLHPSFKDDELERQREQLISSLQVEYADPGYLAQAALDRVVYGPSPYGLPGEGTPDTAKKLARNALASFHDSYYVPNQALLAFAGDITPEAAFAAAEKYFGAWPKKELPAAQIASPPATSGLRIIIVDKPDAVQTQIRIGRLGIARNNPDYIPLLVTNRIFGGGYNSRLNTEVRIHKGLTYGAYSRFEARKQTGIFSAGTFTRTEGTVDATKLVIELIGKMATGEVTPAEMDFARDYLAGVYPIESETSEQVAERVLTVAEFGLPADYNDTYQQRIRAVNAGSVKTVADRYFDAKDLDIILVGNARQFRDALKKAFPDAKYEEVSFDQLDLLAADLRRPKEAAPAATPESLARGRATLEAAAKEAGGAAFGRIESLEISSSGEAAGPGGQPFSVDVRTQVLYPDRIHIELKLPFGAIQQGFDGKTAWAVSPQGAMDLPNNVIGEFQRGIALAGGAIGFYQKTLAGGLEAQYLGEEEITGKKTDCVQWNAPFGPVKLYFDSATHQLIAARFRQFTQQGTVDAEQQWSDFRTVGGIQVPYQTVTLHDGAKFSNFTVQDVKLNTKPDPSLFSKPQSQQ